MGMTVYRLCLLGATIASLFLARFGLGAYTVPTRDAALTKSLAAIKDPTLSIAIALHPDSCTIGGMPGFGWTVECLGVPKHHYSDVTLCSVGAREICSPAPLTWSDCVSFWWDIDMWGQPSNPNGTGGTRASMSDTCREKATISEDRDGMRRRGLSPENIKILDYLAAPNHPGWLVDSRTGCWVWDPDPRPNETATWSGGCDTYGRATGRGILEWQVEGKVSQYEGDLRRGRANGHGVYISLNGSRLDGEWRDDKANGHGIMTYANGDLYDGGWSDNRRNGHGVMTFGNGARYEGDWRDDQKNGHGAMTFADGYRFDGEWRDDHPDGYGEYSFKGEVVRGTWVGGCFHDGNLRAWINRSEAECN
jgi:hypothetical protein